MAEEEKSEMKKKNRKLDLFFEKKKIPFRTIQVPLALEASLSNNPFKITSRNGYNSLSEI